MSHDHYNCFFCQEIIHHTEIALDFMDGVSCGECKDKLNLPAEMDEWIEEYTVNVQDWPETDWKGRKITFPVIDSPAAPA